MAPREAGTCVYRNKLLSPQGNLPHAVSSKLMPSALSLGTVLLNATSKVTKPEFPFTSRLTSHKDLHG